MIVVAIIGILAAVAIPKFAQMRANHYKKVHGVWPKGYKGPGTEEYRRAEETTSDQVLSRGDNIDYIWDKKTGLCFAKSKEGNMSSVACSSVKALFPEMR